MRCTTDGPATRKRARALALCASLAASLTFAQADIQPASPPPLSEAVARALEAPYLSDTEGKQMRVFHGLWRKPDLSTPALAAQAALIRGALDDPALFNEQTPAEDRAEGMLQRGELDQALTTLAGKSSLRAIRIRAQALELLGRTDEADAALEPLVDRMADRRLESAQDLVEGVKGLIIRTRVRGQEQAAGGDFRTLMKLLAQARQEMDRLYWPAMLVEAQLLYEKDSRAEASQVLQQVLTFNPSCAAAWAMLAQMSVDGFDFDKTQAAAQKLDQLAGPLAWQNIDDPQAEASGSSPYAAMALAKSRLRQKDPDGAAQLLEPILKRFPTMREAKALEAAIAAGAYDFERTAQLVEDFDKLSPGSPLAMLQVGRVLSEARQYEAAATYLEKAVDRGPYLAEPAIELGLMQLQAGNDSKALEALEKAALLDPFNVRASNSLKLARELISYTRIESEHFIVRHRPGIDGVLGREMVHVLERIHTRVCGDEPGGINHEPAHKTVIDLMPNHRWFSVRITGLPKIHTMAASTGPVIAMESPREGPGHMVGVYDWARVLQHEYTHTVTLSRTKNRIPHWFTEAAAVYLEDSPRDYDKCQMLAQALESGTLFDLEQINIAFVRPKRPQDRSQAYAQGHWMYEYIVQTWGANAPLELMDLYATGQTEAQAMQQVLGQTQDSFQQAFIDWARKQVTLWGLHPTEHEPSIATLLLQYIIDEEGGAEVIQDQLTRTTDSVAWSAAGGGGTPEPFAPQLPIPTPQMVDQWLNKYPTHPQVLRLAVNLALASGDLQAGGKRTQNAVSLLERYAAACIVDPLPHRQLAKLYLDEDFGTKSDAIPHLEYLDAREVNSAAYAIALARRYAARQQWQLAKNKAERATQVSPFDADYRELAATVALKMNDLKTAERHILALTDLEPDREIHTKRLAAVREKMSR